jgi:hypothetical protein
MLAYHDKEDDDPKLCESLRNKNFTILQNQQCYYHADKVGLHKLFLDIASYLNQL